MANCCNQPFIPLGSPNCTIDFGAIRGILFVDVQKVTYDSNGVPGNLQTLLQEGNAVISPKLYNLTSEKPESTFQEFEDGTRFFIREATRTITAIVPKPTFWQVGAFKRLRCKRSGVYLIDNQGNILGLSKFLTTTTTNLAPIPIERETIDAILAFATDTTIRQLTITLQLSNTIKEEDYAVLPYSDIPSFDTLYWLDNSLTPILVSSLIVNNTTNTVVMNLRYSDNSHGLEYVTDEDFRSTPLPILIGNNLTNPGASIVYLDTPSYNPTTGEITWAINSAGNVATGNSIEFYACDGILPPFATAWSNKITVTVL